MKTILKYRPSLRNKPQAARKRRATTHEMDAHRACMAPYDDSTFCSNEQYAPAFAPPAPPLLLHEIPASARDTPTAFKYDHDYDLDDDSEPGGVPIPTSQLHEPMADVPLNVHVLGAASSARSSPCHNSIDHDDNINDHVPSTGSLDRTLTARRPSHPRPLAADTLQEGDGRRTRFALDGESPEDEQAQFDLDAAASHGLVGLESDHGDTGLTALLQTLLRANSVSHLPQSVPQQPFHNQDHAHAHPPRLQQSNNTYRASPHHTYSMDFDDDSLGVDDPRRHYDFAEFMDNWRLCSMSDKGLPAFVPGAQPSMKLWRPPEHLTRTRPAGIDVQGIRWQLVGPSRGSAMRARAILHPSHTARTFSSSGQTLLEDNGEACYRFRSFVPKHKAQTQHYQLRNSLAASSRNDVFYANGKQVKRVLLACPTWEQTVMDLNKPATCAAGFRITCLSASLREVASGYSGDSVLIAGGFYGEYAIINVDSQDRKPTEGFVTHGYDGLVTHIHNYNDRRSGLLRAAFCSNDRHLRIMDISSLKFADSFKYDHAINCSATSPDGRLRALVGDSTETLITDAERGTPLMTLKEHTDHIFACAWSQDGRYVATGAQDGIMNVWDARKWLKPLRALESTMSCVRSLNFTDSGALVAAENDDVIKIYDAGNFNSRQELRFFGSIAGVALLDGGAEIAVANSDKTVGGLLTFERQPRGIGLGTYGRRIAKAKSLMESRGGYGSAQSEREFVEDVLV